MNVDVLETIKDRVSETKEDRELRFQLDSGAMYAALVSYANMPRPL